MHILFTAAFCMDYHRGIDHFYRRPFYSDFLYVCPLPYQSIFFHNWSGETGVKATFTQSTSCKSLPWAASCVYSYKFAPVFRVRPTSSVPPVVWKGTAVAPCGACTAPARQRTLSSRKKIVGRQNRNLPPPLLLAPVNCQPKSQLMHRR